MPRYTVVCRECEVYKDIFHSISQKPVLICETCGTSLQKIISNPNIHLKGDNWTGKLLKEKELRTRNSQHLGRKQHLEHTPEKVLPNVDGQVVSSWPEAKKLAKDKGYNTSSYDKFGK